MVRKLETKLVIGFLKYNSAFLDDDDSFKEEERERASVNFQFNFC
jgi:hypothetical protein